jgi:probable phosphoglycerate mutase
MDAEDVRFVIVRHGQTRSNRERIIQGWRNTELDETGIAQARAAAAALADVHFDAAYSSDLNRAMMTARIVLESHPGVSPVPCKELREWHLGCIEGLTWEEVERDYPDFPKAFADEYSPFRLEGAETREELQARIRGFFMRTALENPGKTIAIFTHGGVLKRIFRMVTGPLDPENEIAYTENASISEILFRAHRRGWLLRQWNLKPY